MTDTLAARDIAHLIHPYTNLADHETRGPFIAERGEGVYVFDDAGRRYLARHTRFMPSAVIWTRGSMSSMSSINRANALGVAVSSASRISGGVRGRPRLTARSAS